MGFPRRMETQFIRSSALEPVHQANEDPDDRIRHFTRLILELPQCGEAYYHRARALYLKGDLEAALADFLLTLKWSPGHKGALIGQTLVESRIFGQSSSTKQQNLCASSGPEKVPLSA